MDATIDDSFAAMSSPAHPAARPTTSPSPRAARPTTRLASHPATRHLSPGSGDDPTPPPSLEEIAAEMGARRGIAQYMNMLLALPLY